jgi:hypothetical protein
MATTFPASLDSFTNITNPTTTTLETEVGGRSHSEFHNDYNDAIEALEAKVGVDGSAVTSSHTYKITQLEAAFPASSVDSEIALFSSTTGKVLKRATTTGLLKATSGVLSAAAAVTDYVAPGSAVNNGITLNTARLVGRTSPASGALEEISVDSTLSLTGGVLSAGGRKGADVYASASVNLTTTPTAVACNSENWDSGTVHDNVTNNTRLTAPVAGVYMVGITCAVFSNTSGAFQAIATIRKNGSTGLRTVQIDPYHTGAGGAYGNLSFSFPVNLAANDYVEVLVSKSSATPTMTIQNTSTDFSFFMYL